AQRELQALAFDAAKADVEQASHAIVRMTVQLDIADAGDSSPQFVAQRADALDVLLPLALSDFERESHADDLMRRQSARANAGFLTAAVDQRLETERRLATYVQRADTFRSINLVGREREQVDVHRLDVQRQLAGALRGIDVKCDATLAADRADCCDVLHDTDLIIDVHERDQLRVRTQRGLHLLGPHDAVRFRL